MTDISGEKVDKVLDNVEKNIHKVNIDTGITNKEIEDFILVNKKVDEYDNPMYDRVEYLSKIYLPYFIDYIETTVDYDIVDELELTYYDEPKIEQCSKDNTLEARPFKYAMVEYIDKETYDDGHTLSAMIDWRDYKFKDGVIKSIKDTLESKTIYEPNIGFCNKCEECQGHKCGDIVYHIIGWAGKVIMNECGKYVKRRYVTQYFMDTKMKKM